MKAKLQNLKKSALAELIQAKSLDDFNALLIKYLGRKGELAKIMRGISEKKEIEEKKEIGALSNKIKKELQEEFQNKLDSFQENIATENIDVTLPGEKIAQGHLHPTTQIQNELSDIFTSMGFVVLDGPELESDYYCFEALNIHKNHPARDMQDTFYINKKNKEGEYDLVMRTHTSNVQVRAMQKYGAPIRCVVPGRVFRSEATDACHEHTFHQIECLMVDKDISIANLKAVVKEMLSSIFKQSIEVRIRPGFFPFVEPGFEVDISCTVCQGKGCPSCKHSGWLEMMGAGMVHPNVLKHGNIDPGQYSGLAFGMGIDRLAMMRYGIDDIRLFQSGNLKFLEQF